ncbi:hypothetical protein BCR37DRAFT_375902 [Protomyces lactucae-debilis]|uniref:Uncharacterized protein n=1 Tax=Protomyces lactucae-debilis TaxID=2754530 RepID=A0A1Y2FZ56_PROLT|nr:uncharacterized protein BCR37DRAFT_375902 [Protomyces lactucae-debilis]ORY87935.1 hypothetical protein BCR37DRAFT_375902 [Protomyces lactucae-debilis]
MSSVRLSSRRSYSMLINYSSHLNDGLLDQRCVHDHVKKIARRTSTSKTRLSLQFARRCLAMSMMHTPIPAVKRDPYNHAAPTITHQNDHVRTRNALNELLLLPSLPSNYKPQHPLSSVTFSNHQIIISSSLLCMVIASCQFDQHDQGHYHH